VSSHSNVGIVPSIFEGKRWRFSHSEAPCTGREFEDALISLESAIEKHISREGYAPGVIYARGDYFLERTQLVEVADPNTFNQALVKELREWLRGMQPAKWRIVIPTGGKYGSIIIYAGCVCIDGCRLRPGNTKDHRLRDAFPHRSDT
jgi:hypothetical protein